VIIGNTNSQCRRVREKQSVTRVIANPASTPTTFEVEVHHGVIEDIDNGEDKYTAVKVVKCQNSKEDINLQSGTETARQLIQQGPKSTGRGRRTLEIASFDNVFAPYIKPPT